MRKTRSYSKPYPFREIQPVMFFFIAAILAAMTCPARLLAADSGIVSRLDQTIRFLASDELEGRGVGTDGSDQAARFLKSQFGQLGAVVQTQSFTLAMNAEIGPLAENHLSLLGPPNEDGMQEQMTLNVQSDFNPLAIGGSTMIKAPLVFAGYGITMDSFDEYANLDVTGKVVVLLRKEPQQADESSIFAGKRPSQHAFFSTKIANAAKHGAAGVLLVNDQFGINQTAESVREQLDQNLDELVQLRDNFRAIEKPTDAEQAHFHQTAGQLIGQLEGVRDRSRGGFDELLSVEGAGSKSEHPDLPVFFVRRKVVEDIIRECIGAELTALEQQIDAALVPQSHPLVGWEVSGQASIVRNSATVQNVVATIPGKGELADGVVVVGAHYDHLGMGGTGSLAPWTREVHNGADDNASGTAALLEIARRLASNSEEPARTVVLIAFAGEERGLLGSAHYVSNPIYPLEKTVAMVNMDMVGRLQDNRLTIYGTGTGTGFDAMVDELNEVYKFDIVKEPQGSGPSDHASFYRKQIPVFHFFTGMHRDYHRPSDDVDEINFAGLERIAGMVTDVVVRLARQPEPPKYLKVPRRRRGQNGE